MVGLKEVTHNTGNMSKHVEYSGNMARQEFGIVRLGVGITECSISVVIPPGALLVRMHIITQFVLWTLAQNTDMPLGMMYVAILVLATVPDCHFGSRSVSSINPNCRLGYGYMVKSQAV